MYKITETYEDFNGTERTEDFYFNLTKAEILKMETTAAGGLSTMLQNIIKSKDIPSIINIFDELVLKAYGEKSPDGKRFMKSEEITNAFAQTNAYSQIFMRLASDADKAAEFVNGIVPPDIAEEAAKRSNDLV